MAPAMADTSLDELVQRLDRAAEQLRSGELTADALHEIRQHLDRCTDCYQAFDFQAELKAVIAAKCRHDEMPPGLLGRIELCLHADIDGDGRIG